jgi:hypothetical protein
MSLRAILNFTPSFTPRGEHSLLFRKMEGQTDNFTPGDNFVPGVKVKNRPLVVAIFTQISFADVMYVIRETAPGENWRKCQKSSSS